MYIRNRTEIKKKSLETDTMKNVEKQVLIGADQGWDSHVMRMFTLKKNGYTPRHSHPWNHMVYIVSGNGILFVDGNEHSVTGDSVAFIPGGKEHQFTQTDNEDFIFMCIVPTEGDV